MQRFQARLKFESFVNSEECKTSNAFKILMWSLRALLIQKSVKQPILVKLAWNSLRALLIQKSVKPPQWLPVPSACLRALLTQKSVKRSLFLKRRKYYA